MMAHSQKMSWKARLMVIFVCVFCVRCSDSPSDDPSDVPPSIDSLGSSALVLLDTLAAGELATLGDPDRISRDSGGRFVVPDESDGVIKIFDAAGVLSLEVGGPGEGPGEFEWLSSGGTLLDSIVGFDGSKSELRIFSPKGDYVRSLSLVQGVLTVRPIDDSLLLAVSSPLRRHVEPLVEVLDASGNVHSSFFQREEYFKDSAALRQFSHVLADGAEGTVFVVISRLDSIFAYAYDGRALGVGRLRSNGDLPRLRDALDAADGEIRSRDGRWVFDGMRTVLNVAAANDSTVVVQVAPYDGETGIDPMLGGELIVGRLRDDGIVHTIARGPVESGLFGSDRDGAPLLLGYVPSNFDEFLLYRLEIGR